MANGKFSPTTKADADTVRSHPALAVVTGGVLAIGGRNLSTVSKYDIANDTWESGLPELIEKRWFASACALQEKIYVFCGWNGYFHKHIPIEMISETALLSHSQARWQLI